MISAVCACSPVERCSSAVHGMLCEWECDVGELFVTVHCEKAVPQLASAGSDAAETSP